MASYLKSDLPRHLIRCIMQWNWGSPGVFGEQGNTENLAMGTWEQSKKIVGNTGTSNRLGNRGTNTKNYDKTLRFLHKRGGDRRFTAVFLISLGGFCSQLSCLLVSSSGAEIVLFQQVPTGLIFNLSRAIHARQRDSVRTVCWYGRGVQVRPGQFWQHISVQLVIQMVDRPNDSYWSR